MNEKNKILVVDDERINISTLVELLRSEYEMLVAKNGAQALNTAAVNPPDLILLDILMPEMDGYEVCRRLKADDKTCRIPVIFITGMDSINDETKGLELGAVDYITKPVRPAIVKARVKTHISLQQAYKELAAEKQKADKLLLNILPEPIAERLKQGESTIADYYDDVTVLFADIVGFTDLSVKVDAHELVMLLNRVFSVFDQLAQAHGLEKIKTIGDAYMAVGGLPSPRPDHAIAVAEMALNMLNKIAEFNAETGYRLQIRTGIATGCVIAGVIGVNKFIYDLWGDTVNTASRMESHGIHGQIQVAKCTYELLKDRYLFNPRGMIQIKGKGELETYLLICRK